MKHRSFTWRLYYIMTWLSSQVHETLFFLSSKQILFCSLDAFTISWLDFPVKYTKPYFFFQVNRYCSVRLIYKVLSWLDFSVKYTKPYFFVVKDTTFPSFVVKDTVFGTKVLALYWASATVADIFPARNACHSGDVTGIWYSWMCPILHFGARRHFIPILL